MPIEAHDVKKGKHVMLKGRPCKVMDVKTSKTGKHGHMKCNITGIDVLTAKKYNDVVPGHANMIEFKLEKNEYQLIDIAADDMSVSCLTKENASVTVVTDPTNEQFIAVKKAFDEGKDLILSVIRAHVETAKDTFVDVELVEGFKEDKTEAK
jgi:translation initiation factor 5A